MKECTGCRREALKQALCQRCGGTGNEPQPRAVEVWACPNCPNYYAQSSAGDLSTQPGAFRPNTNDATRTRATCPDCGHTRLSCPAIILIPQTA
jgi:hypothetical protein